MHSPSSHSANSNTDTIRHRHKKSRPAPPPPVTTNKVEEKKMSTAEISVGGANSIKAQWRHQPILLITGVVKYGVNVWTFYTLFQFCWHWLKTILQYLGSTIIKEFKGTESTKKSIQKIRKTTDRTSQEIILSISYRGLKFINPLSKVSFLKRKSCYITFFTLPTLIMVRASKLLPCGSYIFALDIRWLVFHKLVNQVVKSLPIIRII